MNFVMVGMIPVMAIMRMKIRAGTTRRASCSGDIINSDDCGSVPRTSKWLVGSGLKHGMMSAVSGKPSMEDPGMSGREHHEPLMCRS
jgi:hypothetical protein